jgi:tetratricopeptide (TPR) repeat protein
LRQPTAAERLTLARLYELTGQWSRCREVMFAAMSEAPGNAQLIGTFIEMSMRHREFADVSLFIERLDKLAPNEDFVKAARGRLLIHQGDVLKGVELIKSLAPTTVTDENVDKLRSIADLLTRLQQHEEAEKMYRAFTAQRPADSRFLARFLATYPEADVHEALQLAEQDLSVSLPRRAEAIANGLTALRNHRVVLEPADYDLVESWINTALADDPNSVSHTLQLAELNDIKGSFDKAEALYRKVIATEGLTDTQMAIAENNLSYLLALTGRAGDEALPMVEDAINRLGPISQLLDTRGMVYLAMEKYGPALSDFEGAIVEEASGMGYYHLALAQQANGDRQAAARSFDSAKSSGFRDTNLSRLERPQFDQLMQVLGEA